MLSPAPPFPSLPRPLLRVLPLRVSPAAPAHSALAPDPSLVRSFATASFRSAALLTAPDAVRDGRARRGQVSALDDDLDDQASGRLNSNACAGYISIYNYMISIEFYEF